MKSCGDCEVVRQVDDVRKLDRGVPGQEAGGAGGRRGGGIPEGARRRARR